MPDAPQSIAIIEDQRLMRENLSLAIQRLWPECSVPSFASFQEALAQPETLVEASVVLVDLLLENEFAHDQLPALRELFPHLKVLVVTGVTHDYSIHEINQLGPEGFVHKNDSLEELSTALARVVAGAKYVSPRISELLAKQRRNPDHFARILSRREQSVLRLIGQGLSNEETAAVVGLSPDTVQSHRRNIMRKLGLHRSTELVNYAVTAGFVDPAQIGNRPGTESEN
jgi:two-component system nitrate/nitrite response regulator NarL